ncbi:MAG: DPP IV N-terminal domain-containing protein [Bacteroidales bacterium]|nr:DPP IV N-terminal domain-containing protein [Bacteroidales bacterium]
MSKTQTNAKNKIILILAMLAAVCPAVAQEKLLGSKQLMSRELYPERPLRSVQFAGNKLAYSNDSVLFMGKAGKMKPVLTLKQLNGALRVSGAAEEMGRMPYFFFKNEEEMYFYVDSKLVCFNLKANRVETLGGDKPGLDFSPDYKRYAYTSGNSLRVGEKGSKEEIVVGNEEAGVVYGQSVHRNEFGISKGTFWSPQGNLLAFYRMDQSMVTDYPMVNTATRIATPAPFKYPMAGMKSHEVTVGVCNPANGNVVYLDTRKDTSVAEREMFLTNVTWSPDEKHLYIAKVNRQQNHMWLESYDAATGKKEGVLFEETDDRYVEPCEGLYFLPGSNSDFLWFSMRDGYKHLYQYKVTYGATGCSATLLRQLTRGEYEVQAVIGFDEKGENLFVYANKDNLAGRGAHRVDMKSGAMTSLTPVEGTHTVYVSKDGTQIVDLWSAVDVPATAVARNAKGKAIDTLFVAENPLKGYAMPGFKLSTLKADDGKTDLYYRLITPPNMEPGKKYPTLVYVYGGPHSQLVTDSWMAGAGLYMAFLAQQGYVVFTLDNRGTDNRGFEFESVTHRRLGDIELADQMQGVKYLQSLPFVDTSRMGVEGWSFGGFMTITMKLAHPEIFKVGCAGGPVVDWKWYEIMYGERYMDTPQENPDGYAANSLLNKAKDLQGRLLVIHGAEDNTVVWQNSLEFVQACIKAGKQVDYFVYPHHEHNVIGYDRIHLYEKMFQYYEDFFK